MKTVSRRMALTGAFAATLARPAIVRAQGTSRPIVIGFLSDTSGLYRENGGPGNKVAAEMAVADFGGSLLGRELKVIQADDQNKADIASSLAREWTSSNRVDLLADGAGSSSGLAIQEVSRLSKCIYVMTGPIANSLIGKQCSPYGFQFGGNAYSLTKGTTTTVTRQGGDTWFTIMPDYESGYTQELDTHEFVKAAGGRIVGAVRTPIGETDYSSVLLQAKSSGAKVIGLGLTGQDVQNCVKQAAEFGISQGGQRLSAPVMAPPDVFAVGQEACVGLLLSSFFYWFKNAKSRAFTDRFLAATGKPPTDKQAASYFAVNHWLKTASASKSLDAVPVASEMRKLPVVDFFNDQVPIFANGCVAYPNYLMKVKPVSETKGRLDIFDIVGTLDSSEANPPPGMFGCPLVL